MLKELIIKNIVSPTIVREESVMLLFNAGEPKVFHKNSVGTTEKVRFRKIEGSMQQREFALDMTMIFRKYGKPKTMLKIIKMNISQDELAKLNNNLNNLENFNSANLLYKGGNGILNNICWFIEIQSTGYNAEEIKKLVQSPKWSYYYDETKKS